jgi:hypothetical protein
MVIPDGQVKPGVNIDHWKWAGLYAARKRPDIIVNLGDMADMPSLSSYDKGKKSFEGRSYKKDIDSVCLAMDSFMAPICNESDYSPELILTLGNHEERIERALEGSRELEGVIGYKDLPYESYGWRVLPYLQTVVRSGVAFSHYFQTGVSGRPVTSAKALLSKLHMSSVMGHVQQRDIAYGKRADGLSITGIFAGVFYSHEEVYLRPQGNEVWRGIWMLHNVKAGVFDEMPVSLEYLKRKFK